MDNFVNNKTQLGINNNDTLQKLPSEIVKSKNIYYDFVKKMDECDFSNTAMRYISELTYIEKLLELYSKYNFPDLLKEFEDRKILVLEKLKNEFGITPK